jgi:hypothetical protein
MVKRFGASTELYASATHMLAQDREIFYTPFEDGQQQTTRTLQSFCTFAKPIVEKSIKEANDFGTTLCRIDDYSIPPEMFDIILGSSCRVGPASCPEH